MQISDLRPAEYNPRTISDSGLAGLKASITLFGLVEPIIYNERTQHIVGGHQRYRVLCEQGVTETDVVIVDLDEVSEKSLNITLNNQHIQGEFTDDLQRILADIKENLPNFAELELDKLFIHDNIVTVSDDIDEITEGTGIDERCGEGDIWQLGEHILICADSATIYDYPCIKNIDIVFTDPPYEMSAAAVFDIIKKYANHFIVIGTFKQCAELYNFDIRFHFDFVIDAHIPKSFMNSKQPYYTHQNGIYISASKETLFDNNNTKGVRSENAYWQTIIDAPRSTSIKHGHAKNVQGMRDILSGFTCDTICDPFAGSGSLLLAAHLLHKKCIAIEMEPIYCDVVIARFEVLTGVVANKIGNINNAKN
jgi:DNA modification methylase